ncbi:MULTISPECIES: esterase-like activity of phytase family protein [unclassified Sphingobium]|uniref:esterase-like activity of phytase family protein n=1 Tax=unclassified Sphingobium TaxID=2611147 RepID=UPI000829E0EA|nr:MULTISPECIES: esterase-like activity of phytase family protein [unclassified Sphingobium]NML88189.1 esterase-like activity of phytase family protein [Sphingobium sp. TB-6]
MRRILIVLLLAILLLPAPHKNKPQPFGAGPLLVRARALSLNAADPAQRDLGRLHYLGGWQLNSTHHGFGGISSLLAEPDGQILALSDSGTLMGFHIGPGKADRRPFIAPLPIRPQDRDRPWWAWDSEAMTHDPATQRYWVGFELQQMICRYSPGFARVEACRTWPEIEAWPETGSIESLARLPDGRFLVLAEMGMTADGSHDTLLFAGDPAEATTAAPMHLRYVPPRGYRPTDAIALDDRHILVLNRRLTLQELFTATLAIVELPERPRPGDRLKARALARLAPPLLADNFEGLAVTQEGGRRVIWIASDDNHEFFQRTLLLKFTLDWNAEE